MKPSQTPGISYIKGIPIKVPNTTYDGDGFFISYNSTDSRIYGDVTTALVTGNHEHFYVLNGDHREGYASLLAQGLEACMDYFRQHIDQKNKYSETPPTKEQPKC